MKVPGAPHRPYGAPSHHEVRVQRTLHTSYPGIAPGAGVSFTPLEALAGMLTPAGLHFERHHSGVPAIDPAGHRLLIHGLVERSLVFSIDDLLRYPMSSRLCFLECSGNSLQGAQGVPADAPCGVLHGLVSCSEWTGVPLAALLDEAGVEPAGRWLLFEGADAAAMTRSLPLELALRGGMLALYQNGERLRPEQGYPVRLLLPGLEGNLSVKWLRRVEVTEGPTHTRDETAKYTDLMRDGRARQFTFPMAVKSVITRPSPGVSLAGPGFYEISGLAWSGAGRIARVEVSADGGGSWLDAELQAPVLSQCLTRFRIPWDYRGQPALLMSRATDAHGERQPTRASWLEGRGRGLQYHYNAIQAWQVGSDGRLRNVHA
jgi:sulfane dehydrogenase subunit SoxC